MHKTFAAVLVAAAVMPFTPTSAAVFDCSTALETTRAAANAIALPTSGTDRAQRCAVDRSLLPLFERQVTVVEICEADRALIDAVRSSASLTRARYQQDCGG
jgi:hypothetical protein